jgi:hypothetical protein
MLRVEDRPNSSPPPSPIKRRHGTVEAPQIFIEPEVTRVLPQILFTSPETTPVNGLDGEQAFGTASGSGCEAGDGIGTSPARIIVTPPTPGAIPGPEEWVDLPKRFRDRRMRNQEEWVDLPKRFRDRRMRNQAVIKEEIETVVELRERERDLTTAIEWIRQEIVSIQRGPKVTSLVARGRGGRATFASD